MASSVWRQTWSKGGRSRGRLVQRPAVGKHEQPGAMTMLDGQTARTLTATCRHQSAVYGCRCGFGNAERKENCIYCFPSATPSTTSQQRPLTHSQSRAKRRGQARSGSPPFSSIGCWQQDVWVQGACTRAKEGQKYRNEACSCMDEAAAVKKHSKPAGD
jgi:hypothetical protein